MNPQLQRSYPLGAQDASNLVRDSLGMGPAYAVKEGPLGSTCYLAGDFELGRDVEAVLAIGAFDGCHVGHRTLLEAAMADARERGVACLAVSFDPDPDVLFGGADAPRSIMSVQDRANMIMSLGFDGVCLLRFDAGLASMAPTAFVKLVLCWIVRPVSVHVGSNFSYGYHGWGNPTTLTACGVIEGFDVVTHDLVERDGSRVSSTRIRALLGEAGQLDVANELLCRCHYLTGRVEHGRGEGTGFGFPTANVRFPGWSCMPAQGVYGGYVVCGERAWPAAINVGAPPTFSAPDELFCEANLIGFKGDLYGSEVSVVFVQWLRASRPFSSTEELERVVLGNIDWVRTNLGDGCVEV